MALSTIRAAIKTILEGVPGIGIVHDYERWAASWEKFLALFKDSNDRINGCTITRTSTPQRMATVGSKDRAHVFTIRFVYGLKDEDATEKTFQDLIEAAVAAFDADETLGGACLTISPDWGSMADLHGLQVETVESRLFGTVLCHYAECRLGVIESVET